MYLLFISWKSGEHSHYPLANWAQLQSKLTELGLTPSPLNEGHTVETGYYMEGDSTWYSWAEVNPREVFMDLYRNSETLNDCMSADDCAEVFEGILKGSSNITVELLNSVLSGYETDLRVVDVRIMDAELNKKEPLFIFWRDGVKYKVAFSEDKEVIHLFRVGELSVLCGRLYSPKLGTLREQGLSMLEAYRKSNSSLESLLGH